MQALVVALAVARRKARAKAPQSRARELVAWGVDAILPIAGLWSIWAFYSVQSQMETAPYEVRNGDVWPALAGIVVFLELCRRLRGPGVFGVGIFGVVYLLYGQHPPGILEHAGFIMREIAQALWYNTNKGLSGPLSNIVLTTVFIFIIFGALLEGTGAGDTLLKFAFLVTRRTRGGPAHAAILASSLFGTMSGSTVANIVGTGTPIIPMIIKRGFSKTFAAGGRPRRRLADRSCRRSWGPQRSSWRT